MANNSTAINVFFTVLLVMLALAVFVPFFNVAFEDSNTINTNSVISLENTVLGSNYLTILLNVAVIPLWTFGLNIWINLLILLPMRIIGLIALWYIITPTK